MILGLGCGIAGVARDKSDGLLAHESVFYGLTHIGMRQYWRDLDCLERFTKSEPHRTWWRDLLRDSGGSGFWHETYRMRGGMEAIYIDMPRPTGFGLFAQERQPQGPFIVTATATSRRLIRRPTLRRAVPVGAKG